MATAIASQTTAPVLSRFVTEISQKTADREARKAALYNLASKVCLAAFLAIAVGALAVSLGLPLTIPSTLAVLLLLSTLPLQAGFQIFLLKSIDCSSKSSQSREIAAELTRIQNWKSAQIEAFFKEHKLTFAKIPMDLLKRIDSKEPLRALLPVIAYYNYFRTQAMKFHLEHLDNIHNSDPNRHLRYEGRRIGWHVLEFQALPAALDAAVMLQTIAEPTLQSTLKDIGICKAKEFDERRFDQLLDGTDDYFVFNEKSRPTLNFNELQEILSKQDIDVFRAKLFDLQSKK